MTINTNLVCELQSAVKVQYLDGNLFSQDVQGNVINVTVLDGGEPATLSGSVSANIIRADGGTVAATGGTFAGNVASITLPAAAYSVPGVVSIVVKITDSGVTTTIAAVVANIYQSSTDTVVDPGTIIPSVQTLISAIDAAVASIPADYSSLWSSLAPNYSIIGFPVYTGYLCTYDGVLYRAKGDILSSETWNSSHWAQVNIGDYIHETKSAFNHSLSVAGENLLSISDFDTPTDSNVTFSVSGGKITITNGSSANYAGLLTSSAFLAKLATGRMYRFHARCSIDTGNGTPIIAAKAGNNYVNAIYIGVSASTVVDFVVDSNTSAIALMVAFGSSTSGSVVSFDELWVKEMGKDTVARNDIIDLKSALDETNDALGDLFDKSVSADYWAQGYWAIGDGTAKNASDWIRTKSYVGEDISYIENSSNLLMYLHAYDKTNSGAYVGTLINGQWSTTYVADTGLLHLDMDFFRRTYPNYEYQVSVKAKAGGSITPSATGILISFCTAKTLKIEEALASMNNFEGVELSSAGDTYRFMMRALNTSDVSFYDLLRFTAGKTIVSDGSISTSSGHSATEDFMKFPTDITVVTGSGITVNAYFYNSSKVKTGSQTILQNKTATISASSFDYLRLEIPTESYSTAPITMTLNTDGIVFAEIDALTEKITNGMIPSSVGNQITARYVGYMAKTGVPDATATSYNYTNKIPVVPGQTVSFWRTDSDTIVPIQCRFLCAYNSEGTAVSAKGAEYVRTYTVPDGIYAIVISFGSSVTNAMAIFGIKMPSQYVSTKKDLYIAGDEFAETQETLFLQKQRNNEELKSGILYYLDRKSAVCYCKPQNLTTAKIIIYFNGNEVTAGSSACFVDFANGTFGFYKAFGVYSSGSLVVDFSETVGLTFDADHEYCIEYKRHSVSPGYTLKITDMMTLESDDISTTTATNGWGMIGYDATDVTVNGFKRLTDLPKNPTVLILGDSYTEGGTIWSDRDKRWCYLLGEAVGSYAINGQGGARSDHILSWFDDYLFDVFSPKYVIIETGTNEQATAYFTRNMTDIITKVKAIGAKPILCTVPVTTAKANPSDYNTFVLNSGLPFIDICRALTVNGDRSTQNLDYFLTDKIHPNIEGHQRIFEMAKLNVPELFRDVSL